MASTPTIPEHFPETWDRSWHKALQQTQPRLSAGLTPDFASGERKSHNIGGKVRWKKDTARIGQTVPVDYRTEKAWLDMEPYDAPILLDKWDKLKLDTILLPTSRVMMDQTFGWNRLCDEIGRDAIQGRRTIGAKGLTEEEFPGGKVISEDIGGNNSGLNWAKVKKAGVMMDLDHVPLEMRYFAIGANQKDNLLSLAQAVHRDYVSNMFIKTGQFHGMFWAGFTWLQYEYLTLDANNDRHCLAWFKPDVLISKDMQPTRVTQRDDLAFATQIYPCAQVGGARIQNSAYIIKCRES